MAVLTAPDRLLGRNEFLTERNAEGGGLNLSKAELQAAFDGLDAFFNTNAAAINTAIPLPARTVLTTPQKALLAISVLKRRFLSGV